MLKSSFSRLQCNVPFVPTTLGIPPYQVPISSFLSFKGNPFLLCKVPPPTVPPLFPSYILIFPPFGRPVKSNFVCFSHVKDPSPPLPSLPYLIPISLSLRECFPSLLWYLPLTSLPCILTPPCLFLPFEGNFARSSFVSFPYPNIPSLWTSL